MIEQIDKELMLKINELNLKKAQDREKFYSLLLERKNGYSIGDYIYEEWEESWSESQKQKVEFVCLEAYRDRTIPLYCTKVVDMYKLEEVLRKAEEEA